MSKKFIFGAIVSFLTIYSDFSTASYYDCCVARKARSPYRFSVSVPPQIHTRILKDTAPIYLKTPLPQLSITEKVATISPSAPLTQTLPVEEVSSPITLSQTQVREVIKPIFSSTPLPQIQTEIISSPIYAPLDNSMDNLVSDKIIAVNLDQTANYLVNYCFLQLHSRNSQREDAEREQRKFLSLSEKVSIFHTDPAVQLDIEKDIEDLRKIISITMKAALYVQTAFETLEWKEGTYERVKYNFITSERGFRWLNKRKADFAIDHNLIDQQLRILREALPQLPRSLSWQEDEINCLKNSF